MAGPDRYFDWRQLVAGGDPVDVVADPRRRLGALLLSFVLLLGAVLVRAAALEAGVGEAYRQSTTRGRSVVERLPALRGRLLARDGTVLSCDEPLVAVSLEYRYLEQPLDEAWLRSLARRRLSAGARRNPQARNAEAARLRREIAELHRRLSALCGVPDEEWRARCRDIQQRVGAMALRVNDRRERAYLNRVTAGDGDSDADAWPAAIRRAILELFAPPAELPPAKIDIHEEHDFHVVARGVPLSVVVEIESQPNRYPGVRIQREVRRRYPHGSLAAHAIGYVGAAAAEVSADAEPAASGSPRPAVGRSGAERAAEPWLRGTCGLVRRSLDSRGHVVESLVERRPRAGRDVILSLDTTIQQTAERLLDEFQRDRRGARAAAAESRGPRPGGSIVVIDVHNGAVLAAAAAPRFDPNVLVAGEPGEVGRLLSDADRPLFDRTAQMAIAPGSVFKTLTAIALLESGTVDPNATFDCRGYLHQPGAERCEIFRRYGIGHGPVNLFDALSESCNVYFYHHAEQLGAAPLVDWAARFGFGQPTLCDWCRDAAGNLPSPPDARRRGTVWRAADTEELAVGQGRLTATPLQVVRLMAAVANGGRLVTPHLLFDLGLPAESDSPHNESDPLPPAIDPLPSAAVWPVAGLEPQTLALVRRGLEQVVASPNGTGYATVRLAGVAIAGKTGTAETGGGQADHAWFAGYAPADDPQVALVVALEHGGEGAAAAGPIARQLVEQLEKSGHLAARGRH